MSNNREPGIDRASTKPLDGECAIQLPAPRTTTSRKILALSEMESGMNEQSHKSSGRASLSHGFSIAAQWTARQCGRATTFALACAAVVIWALTGPMFHYSDTWQLVINTGTTIITFLMVFLIQNTQNRDMSALHLKLDELIRVSRSARNTLLDLEDMTEEELEHIKGRFTKLAGTRGEKTLLREAAADLETAEEEIREAKDKVAAASGGRV